MTAGRWGALDVARGLAVLAMVCFHLIWDLGHFGYIAASIPWSAPVKAFGHSIAFSFLFIAGLSLSLAHRDGVHWRAFWRRFAIVAGAAGLVSLGTYIVFPNAFVFFGILHCIAAASLLALGFLFLPWPAALVAGASIFAAPYFLASPDVNSKWLLWLGLSTSEPFTQDWRPFFPWAGAMLLGLGAGRLLLSSTQRAPAPAEAAEASAAEPPDWLRSNRALPAQETQRITPLGFIGQRSLLIYLVHQPLLFAVFSGFAMLAPPPETGTDFVAECERSCREEGAETGFCHNACVCTAEEAARSEALAGAKDEAERGKKLQEIAGKCIAAQK
jgi:uncharacterized membrane protein